MEQLEQIALAAGPCSLLEAYRRIATLRAFEERCLQLSHDGVITGSIHLCLGQEAIPIGALSSAGPTDRVLATYRGHGWAMACGVPLVPLLAEICHRAGGINGGRAGSALLTSPAHRFLGENSIVGAGVPIGAGVAMALQARRDGGVALVSIGDGAMNQGSVTEGLVFAASRDLPLVVVCENNGWSEMTPISRTTRVADLARRADGIGIRSAIVDGGDPHAVADAFAEALAAARAGAGPVLLECKTVRLGGHYNRDIEHYRPASDREEAVALDPIGRLRARLVDEGAAADIDAIDGEVHELIDAVTEQVLAMPTADPASATAHVGDPLQPSSRDRTSRGPATALTYQRAVNAALRTELEERPEVVVYGEDVGHAGGIFGVTRSLQKAFSEARVFDTPIAESAILGSAVGAAMEGMRPVVEIMWADFLLVALDQLVNQAANIRYISRSERSAPLVVRVQQGATPGSCAQHSQSLEAILAHIPGLQVGLPATPADAHAMTRAAIASDDPTVLIEARALYQDEGEVHLDAPIEPVGGARLRRDGRDVAIVTWGTSVRVALAAAEHLAVDGIEIAVVDLRWLRPLDDEALAEAVYLGEGNVLVLHEAVTTGGFGAEVAARIHEQHADRLAAPVTRLGALDTRMPAAPGLQAAVLPQVQDVVNACRALVERRQTSKSAVR